MNTWNIKRHIKGGKKVMSFITDLAPHAQKVGAKYNILPSLIMAQACLESNYGQSGLAVKGKNLFGIKGSYEGQSVSMETTEYKNGQAYKTTAKFRKYPSWFESLEDLCLLYCNGVSWDRGKYHSIIGEKHYEEAAKEVQAAGYATDPHYADKLVQVIVRNRLNQYDIQTPAAKPKKDTYTGLSLVDYLKSIHVDSSFSNRQKLAVSKGIYGYTGTAEQNSKLLKLLRGF
jgi:flagellum-specific peptidoglycan hydrolase FlgJ